MPVQVTDGQAVHPASVSRLSCRIFHGQVVPQPVGFYLQDAGAGTLFLPVFPREVSGRFQRALHGDVTVAVYRQHRFAFVILSLIHILLFLPVPAQVPVFHLSMQVEPVWKYTF